jgi:hypothetical protein
MGRWQIGGVPSLYHLNQACRYAAHLVAMKDSAILAQGAPAEIVTEGLIEQVFSIPCPVISDPVTGTPMIVPGRGVTREARDVERCDLDRLAPVERTSWQAAVPSLILPVLADLNLRHAGSGRGKPWRPPAVRPPL